MQGDVPYLIVRNTPVEWSAKICKLLAHGKFLLVGWRSLPFSNCVIYLLGLNYIWRVPCAVYCVSPCSFKFAVCVCTFYTLHSMCVVQTVQLCRVMWLVYKLSINWFKCSLKTLCLNYAVIIRQFTVLPEKETKISLKTFDTLGRINGIE